MKARFFHAVQAASLGPVIEVDLHGELLNYTVRDEVLTRLELLDGKLLLVTISHEAAPEIVQRCKDLADIERGFRMHKPDIAIGPVQHRLPKRIRAHATSCFIALLMHRVTRQRLKAKGSQYFPHHAQRLLQRIQQLHVRLNGQPAAARPSNAISSPEFDSLVLPNCP